MGCACNKKKNSLTEFLWIPPEGSVDGEGTVRYPTEIQAKAKVLRSGGTWRPVPKLARR